MGVCEPGQGGNAAAISNTFMCLGEPPRLSPASAPEASGGDRRGGPLEEIPGETKLGGPMADYASNKD